MTNGLLPQEGESKATSGPLGRQVNPSILGKSSSYRLAEFCHERKLDHLSSTDPAKTAPHPPSSPPPFFLRQGFS